MKLNLLAAVAAIVFAGQAMASIVILNPRDANVYGQQLTCTVPDVYNPPAPPQPPQMVLVPIGETRRFPDMACINNISASNNDKLGKAAENCRPQIFGPSTCDSSNVIESRTDQNCYNSVARKAMGPLNSGQQHAIEKGCEERRSICLVYRPAN